MPLRGIRLASPGPPKGAHLSAPKGAHLSAPKGAHSNARVSPLSSPILEASYF